MNKAQRQRIAEIQSVLESALNDLEEIKSEEEDKYDNLPDSLRDSEKGETIQEGVDTLDDALSYLQDALNSLYDIDC